MEWHRRDSYGGASGTAEGQGSECAMHGNCAKLGSLVGIAVMMCKVLPDQVWVWLCLLETGIEPAHENFLLVNKNSISIHCHPLWVVLTPTLSGWSLSRIGCQWIVDPKDVGVTGPGEDVDVDAAVVADGVGVTKV